MTVTDRFFDIRAVLLGRLTTLKGSGSDDL